MLLIASAALTMTACGGKKEAAASAEATGEETMEAAAATVEAAEATTEATAE